MQTAAATSSNISDTPTTYDHVRYPSHPFGETHPDLLATLGSLFGMNPARLESCRVLELGCGEGANLIPMAFQWPGSEFVGIDLSTEAIRYGNDFIGRLGLRNILLRSLDIMEIDKDFGSFDYILVHGVYSWVPAAVREKVLSIFRQNLAPQGIAFVSYNCYPGCHSRDIARQIMRYHVRDEADPQERAKQSRAVLQFLAEASAEDTIYGFELRNQLDRINDIDDRVLFHDDLSDVASPFYLHQVVEAAARHGLQYLSDAAFAMSHLGRLSPKARERLSVIPEDDVVTREQYMDFVEGRAFRESLFCHREVTLQRRFDPKTIEKYHLATSARAADGPVDPAAAGIVTFKTESGSTLSTDHRLSKAMIQMLGARWPETMCFADALEQALLALGPAAGPVRANLDEEVEALGSLLYRAFSAGQFELHRSPPSLTATIGARPRASFLARQQAENGVVVTNLRHRSVSLKDEAVRKFLILVDGTRTVQDLVFDLKATIPEGVGATVTHDGVEENLRLLAKLGLLVPDGAGFDAAPAPPGGAIPMPAPTHDRHATGGI
jgi:methyltransferase-like protein/2-polyprenyl-3-methyl-5-hydroxy-6-metoxy-1,4-benzoquinol methylase